MSLHVANYLLTHFQPPNPLCSQDHFTLFIVLAYRGQNRGCTFPVVTSDFDDVEHVCQNK